MPHDPGGVRLLTPSGLALSAVLLAVAWAAQPQGHTFAQATAGASSLPPASAADRVSQRMAAEAERAGRRPEGVIPLLQIARRWNTTTPARTAQLLRDLCASKRLSPERRVLACRLAAQGQVRLGQPQAAIDMAAELGYVTRFRVVGGFDNEGKLGLDVETPVEQSRMQAPDRMATFAGKERRVSWRSLPDDIVRSGYVAFNHLLRPVANVCGVAETFVRSERARPLSLWFGGGGANKVYWNGELVLRDASYRQPFPDRHAVGVHARAGWNRVLVKTCVTEQAWGFYLRLGEPDGSVVSGLEVAPDTPQALEIEAVASPAPKVTEAPLALLERAAKAKRPSADALEQLARFLSMTGSDDAAERRAKQLSAQAATMAPSVSRYLLAAQLAEERAEVMRFAAAAAQRFPSDDRVRLLRARVTRDGLVPEDALPLLAAIGPDSESYVAAQLQRAAILRDLDLAQTAVSVLTELRRVAGDTPALLRALSGASAASSDVDSAVSLRAAALALRYDDLALHRVLAQDALSRGQTAAVLEHVDAMVALAPGNLSNLRQVAELYEGLGRDDMVLSTYRRAAELVPESAEVQFSYARQLLQVDQSDAAAEALRTALKLSPQHREARELLEQLKPEVRPDEAYAVTSEELLALRSDGAGYSNTVLHDLTVATVFENGLGSRYTQWAVQVHDEGGARNHRTHSIQYDPDSQRVDVRLARVYRKDGRVLESIRTFEQQLGEPWYRIYYDTRALVVVFPDLEPGDVVELRYRVDDIAQRNLYADYYGSLHLLQGYVPTAHREVVLITPTSREFYHNEPKLAGLQHDSRVEGPQRIERWLAKRVPALVVEDGMPGPTEVSPYLHISTYRTWEDVGHWYWGLIKDQLYADTLLKEKVAELTAGVGDLRQKVQRIHNWVVNHTRYVGLEFGIHGFLPYRVPLIVQRGFGDCKDKASLLYTMLREAGIDARIVLVRTRRNGQISDLPASLAVFDHAIAYVPELELFLDGTAEHSGTSELPEQDQGVTVLIVGPEDTRLATTPVFDAERNRRHRVLTVAVAEDGSAQVSAEERVTGAEAAGYRTYYQAPGTRSERFERALGGLYPGVKLESQSFDSLTDLESPVHYTYRIRVPQLGHWDGDQLRLPVSSLSDLTRSMARTPSRKHLLDLERRSAYLEERTVKLPDGLVAGHVPTGGEASSSFGSLTLSFEQAGDRVIVRTEFTLARDRVAPSEYPAFRRWVEQADQLLKQRISLRRSTP